MRKYLVATAIGAMLVAGQAAATDSAVVNLGDRIGLETDSTNGLSSSGGQFVILSALLLGGLLIWGFSEGGHGQSQGRPASP